jgi:hypothetical protein
MMGWSLNQSGAHQAVWGFCRGHWALLSTPDAEAVHVDTFFAFWLANPTTDVWKAQLDCAACGADA